MYQITLKVDGMACGMCETHINDAIRRSLPVKKVTSSHQKGETVILSEETIAEERLKHVIAETGYAMTGYACALQKTKKGLLGWLKK